MAAASATRKFMGERNPPGTVSIQDWWTRRKARRCGTWSSNLASIARASSRNRRMPEMRVPTSPEERAAEAMAPRRHSTVTATKR